MRRAVVVILVLAFAVPAVGGASGVRASGKLVFYTNLADSVPGLAYNPNTPRVRPTGVLMFEDGSWDIEKLRWSSWGGAVARASGISSASTGVPNVATAPRTKAPAVLVVSRPERLFGREVYGCFQLTIPSHPASDQQKCLKRSYGNQYDYKPVSKPSSNPAAKAARFYTPSRNIYCGMSDDGSAQSGVFCEMLKPPAIASLVANGRVTFRRGAREVGNPGEGDFRSHRLLPYGSSASAGRFRCRSALAGVTCVVIKTGKGFFISKQSVRAVG
jgi:hypothetical protein